MRSILICFYLFGAVFFSSLARGDPVLNPQFYELLKTQNNLLSDLVLRYEAGYDPGKTGLAAFLEHEEVKKYLEGNARMTHNTGIMLTKMDALKQSVDSFGGRLDGFEKRLGAVEIINESQAVTISRNTNEVDRLRYIAWSVAGFLGLMAWKMRNRSGN